MRNYSLKPTENNVLELLKENPIRRNSSVFQFVRLLTYMEDDCYTIALNGDWGSGKTFFVKQVKLVLDAFNPQSCMSDENRKAVRTLYQGETERLDSAYATVYYDAWACDNHEDPILSLVYAAVQSGQGADLKEGNHRLVEATAEVFDAVTGTNFKSLVQGFKKLKYEDRLSAIKETESLKGKIQEFIDSLIAEKGNRLVFFIDELDRCKPDYAIRFLERIKHYFDDDRITFVFSVNLSQLVWTVRNYYGNGLDATKYLDKFFDLQIAIPNVDYENFLRNRLQIGSDDIAGIVCHEVVKQFGFSLRQAERYARLIRIARPHLSWINTHRESDMAKAFAANFIIPILIGLQMYDLEKYHNFVTGNDSEPMIMILVGIGILESSPLLNRGETLVHDGQDIEIIEGTEKKLTKITDRLEEVYHALYGRKDALGERTKVIGRMRFTDSTRAYVESIAAMLFSDAAYNFE